MTNSVPIHQDRVHAAMTTMPTSDFGSVRLRDGDCEHARVYGSRPRRVQDLAVHLGHVQRSLLQGRVGVIS